MGVALQQSLLTSADALLLSRQDPRSVDDADAVQYWVGQLGTHEPAGQQCQGHIRVGQTLIQVSRGAFSPLLPRDTLDPRSEVSGVRAAVLPFLPLSCPRVQELSFPDANLLVKVGRTRATKPNDLRSTLRATLKGDSSSTAPTDCTC